MEFSQMARLFVLIFCVSFEVDVSLSDSGANSFRKQEKYVDTLKSEGETVKLKFPSDDCFNKVLSEIGDACSYEERVENQRLRTLFAFKIFDCYAKFTHQKGLNCAPDNVTQCLQDFIAKNKADVLEIYKHLERLLEVDSLCALLKHEEWKSEMAGIMDKLLETAIHSVEVLQESLAYQEKLHDNQDEALRNQRSILQQGEENQVAIDESYKETNESFSMVFTFLEEQAKLLNELFIEFNILRKTVAFLLGVVQGELSTLHSLFFLVMSVSISFELSRSRYTKKARPWLYLVCCVEFLVEGVINAITIITGEYSLPFLQIGFTRRLSAALCLFVLGVSVFFHIKSARNGDSRTKLKRLSQKLEDIEKRFSVLPRDGAIPSPVRVSPLRRPYHHIGPHDVSFGEESTDSPLDSTQVSLTYSNLAEVSNNKLLDVDNKKMEDECPIPDNMPFEDEEREKGTVEVMEKETLKKVIKSQRKRRTTKPKEKMQVSTSERRTRKKQSFTEEDSLFEEQPSLTRYNLRRSTAGGTPIR